MKKALLLVLVLAAALAITYLLLRKGSSAETVEKRDEPLAVSSNSTAFNRSFSVLMNDYYKLSDAFVDWDSAAIREKANKLTNSADSLHLNLLKADTSIIQTAENLVQSIAGEVKGLNGETSMEGKKRELNMITDELYSLIRTVRYDGGVIYHMRCPIAFSDSSEGYWLSPNNQIVNPYLGKKHPVYKDKMLGSGEVSDSIHFAVTQ
jgi:Protein of unknown function (DUF3347)